MNLAFGRQGQEGIFQNAVNPSMEAPGKTSCFSRSVKSFPDPGVLSSIPSFINNIH